MMKVSLRGFDALMSCKGWTEQTVFTSTANEETYTFLDEANFEVRGTRLVGTATKILRFGDIRIEAEYPYECLLGDEPAFDANEVDGWVSGLVVFDEDGRAVRGGNLFWMVPEEMVEIDFGAFPEPPAFNVDVALKGPTTQGPCIIQPFANPAIRFCYEHVTKIASHTNEPGEDDDQDDITWSGFKKVTHELAIYTTPSGRLICTRELRFAEPPSVVEACVCETPGEAERFFSQDQHSRDLGEELLAEAFKSDTVP